MLVVIWILTLMGLVLWSLATWGLHTLLAIDPRWIDDVDTLLRHVPYADLIDHWLPGWHGLLTTLLDLAQWVLFWVGNNAPLIAWIVWAIGTIALLSVGIVLTLIVCLLRDKPTASHQRQVA